MLLDYLHLGGEIANSARLQVYAETVGTPLTAYYGCGCSTLTAEVLGDAPYTTPAADGAPWYDASAPESAQFAGVMVLSAEGLDDNPVERTVTRAAAGVASLGPVRAQPRTITVTALLLGATCCAVEYGRLWLAQALQGCSGGGCNSGRDCTGAGCSGGCGGDTLTLYNCCPGETETAPVFAARHRRTLRRVALISGPTVVARTGEGCSSSGGCSAGADLVTVEFVLTAATPWAWTDPVPMVDVPVPGDDGECITWCAHGVAEPGTTVCMELADSCPTGTLSVPTSAGACGVSWPVSDVVTACSGLCRFAPCPDMDTLCSDPSCTTPTPPEPPKPDVCFCLAVAVNSGVYDLDLSSWPRWFGAVPIIEVHAGSQLLRRLTVTFYERLPEYAALTCEEVVEAERCTPHSVYIAAYVPMGGVLTMDGQVGRATVTCGGSCTTSPDAYGADGGPLAFPLLTCARYCVVVEADAIVTPADDATVTISLSGREY